MEGFSVCRLLPAPASSRTFVPKMGPVDAARCGGCVARARAVGDVRRHRYCRWRGHL
jgi:hypothetical protein